MVLLAMADTKITNSASPEGGQADQKKKTKEPAVIKSWYMEQHESVVIQRNILLLGIIGSFILIMVGVWFIKRMQESHTVEPFVIQIEEKTGVPTVVDPVDAEQFTANEAIKRHFIIKYVKAREEYTLESHNNNKKIVRQMSSNGVSREYYQTVKSI